MEELTQKEEYMYIIKNYDVQKLIESSGLPKADTNVIRDKILSDDVDLSEKLKILNYLLKYQKSEYYRGQVIIDTTKNLHLGYINEPGYYLLEVYGANAGCLGSLKDSMSSSDPSDNSIRNFIIQPKGFKNKSNTKYIYFTTDFKWYLFDQENGIFYGEFELNSKAIFLHLKRTYDYDISGLYLFNGEDGPKDFNLGILEEIPEENIALVDQKFYDYSSYNVDPMMFFADYKSLSFEKLGFFEPMELTENESITIMENMGIPESELKNWDSLDIRQYPKYRDFIDSLIYKERKEGDPVVNLPISCTEKKFPRYITLNKNFSAGGSGAKLYKIIKVKRKVYCSYEAGIPGNSNFLSPTNGGFSSFGLFTDANCRNKLFEAKSNGGFATIDGKNRVNNSSDQEESVYNFPNKKWIDSVDNELSRNSNEDISFEIGEKSFLENDECSLDNFSGRSKCEYFNSDSRYIEAVDENSVFYGSEIPGQGMHLNDFENTYYTDPENGYVKLSYLGPLSSNTSLITYDDSNELLSTVKSASAPHKSRFKFSIKTTSQKYLLDLDNSKLELFDIEKGSHFRDISLYDLLYNKSDDDDENKNLNLSIEKFNQYYTISFDVIDYNINLVIRESERFYGIYDAELVGNEQDTVSITDIDFFKLEGTAPSSSVSYTTKYKNNDYSFDSKLNSLYNRKSSIIEDFDGLKKTSNVSLNNINYNFYFILRIVKKIQISFSIGNSLDLEKSLNHKNEVYLKEVIGATITNIEYTDSLSNALIPCVDTKIEVVNKQEIYIKVTFNTFRIRVSKILSGLSSNQELYPLNFDIVQNKQIDIDTEQGPFFQWIKFICNPYSENIKLCVERNTYRLKLLLDLYNLLDYKTIDNKEDYEYGEEVLLSFILSKDKYISLRNVLKQESDGSYKDYILRPKDEEKFESSILVGKYSLNTIRFGESEQYSDENNPPTFSGLLDGKVDTVRKINIKNKKGEKVQNPNCFFTTANKTIFASFAEEENVLLYFRMPQNDIYLRLTTDFNPVYSIVNICSGDKSVILNKQMYFRHIMCGGKSGNGGSGASLGSYLGASRCGGCGGSGFIGGGAGNGSSCTDWGFAIGFGFKVQIIVSYEKRFGWDPF